MHKLDDLEMTEEEYNKIITIYISSFLPSIYNSNKGNSKETTTETTENITKNITKNIMEWEEFCKSKGVWNTLRRRPRINDYLDYKNNRLIIREDE